MGLPSRVIRKSIEDAKAGRPEPQRVPGGGCRLIQDNRQPAAQELLDFRFFSRLGFQPHCQRHFDLLVLSNHGSSSMRKILFWLSTFCFFALGFSAMETSSTSKMRVELCVISS